MAVTIAAMAIQCSQGNSLAELARALLGEPRPPQAIVLHGDRYRYHRLSGAPQQDAYSRLHALLATALAQARLGPELLADSALFLGTSSHSVGEDEQRYLQGEDGACPLRGRRQGVLAEQLAAAFSLGAGCYTLSTACTSSANALLLAGEAIAAGDCRAAVVATEEGFNQTSLRGFDGLMLLADEHCHPFDVDRDGMVPGEGAGVVVLLDSTLLPADSPWQGLRWRGGASACDPEGITCSSAGAMAAVMAQALDDAGAQKEEIALLKAHGTGSLANDATEAEAMRAFFADELPPFTLLKGPLGHTLGACGLLELVALLACLRAGYAPPAHGCHVVDPQLGCAPLREAMPFAGGLVMLNQFGFGGNNTSLLLEVSHV